MSSTTYYSCSNFRLIIDALASYTDQTGIDLSNNPFSDKLQLSKSPDAIIELFLEREKAFKDYRDGNRTLINWLTPAVQVLQTFSLILGESLSLVPFSPAKAIFVGIDVLLAAASSVSSSYDALLDLFECIGNFLQRLTIYTKIPPTREMTDIIVKIMVELLSVLALATKQIQQGRLKKFAKKLLGESEVESVLQRLDRLTENESRMTVAQTLDVVHRLVSNVKIVMDDGKASMDSIREALVTIHQTANEVNKIKRDQLQNDIQSWLSPPDPSMNQDIVSEARHIGTTTWFLESNVLRKWKTRGSLLWIHGKPGSGKSTLLSAIIQDIEEMCDAGLAALAYYYFDFRDVEKQNRKGLLSSLLSQLCAESDLYCDILSRFRSSRAGRIRRPTYAALAKCLKDMLTLPGQGTPSAREEVLELVHDLISWRLPNLHLCLTSRPEIDIRTVLEPLNPLHFSLHDEIGQKKDIIDYIKAVVHSDRNMRKWREEDQQLVIDTLSEKADGMFRWVVCQVDRLRRSFPASIQSALNDLPKSLDETYERTLLGIDDEKREYSQRLFRCLAVSIRPLRVEELAEIFAVQFEPIALPVFNTSWRPINAEEAILSACSSLIAIVDVDGSQVVQFAHFSVKEFLTSHRLSISADRLSYYHIDPVAAHTVLSHASLSVLLQLGDKSNKDTISHLPLALYAARYWIDHARFGDVSMNIQDAMGRLFDSAQPHFAAWVWLYDIDHNWVEPMSRENPTQPQAPPLYYASLCGLSGLVGHLVTTHPSDVNARGGCYITPLHAAAIRGHLEVAQLLLRNGADPNSRDDDGWTPLHLASRGGHQGIAGQLIEHSADVNSQDVGQRTPLLLASMNGKLEAARLLLDHGANINPQDNRGLTPLLLASQFGHVDVVQLLLDSGSDVEARDNYDSTALHLAAQSGHLGVVQLLLRHGASMDALDNDYWTPLHSSSRAGHLDVVRLLVKNGADLNAEDKDDETPWDLAERKGRHDVARFLIESRAAYSQPNEDRFSLHTASKNGNLAIVRSLLESGEEVDLLNMKQQTPLFLASSSGKLEISQFLLENGANPNFLDKNGWGALHVASRKGHVDLVRLLLNHGVDVDARTADGRTPLDHASTRGYVEVVRLLISHGANLDARDESGWTSLHRASYTGQLEVVRVLLEHGASADAEDVISQTPLEVALKQGNLEIAELLRTYATNINVHDMEDWTLFTALKKGRVDIVEWSLELGEDVNAQNWCGQTALDLASFAGHLDVVQLLLNRGANVDSRDKKGWSPLHSAAQEGHLEIANLLLEYGAKVNARNNEQCTPLYWAAYEGHLGIVQLLLRRGANAQLENSDGETPFQIAWAQGHRNVAELLSAASRI